MVASIRANPRINAHASSSENCCPSARTKKFHQALNRLCSGQQCGRISSIGSDVWDRDTHTEVSAASFRFRNRKFAVRGSFPRLLTHLDPRLKLSKSESVALRASGAEELLTVVEKCFPETKSTKRLEWNLRTVSLSSSVIDIELRHFGWSTLAGHRSPWGDTAWQS